MTFYNSLDAAMSYLQANGLTHTLFEKLLVAAPGFQFQGETRRLLYGLVSVVEEPERVPAARGGLMIVLDCACEGDVSVHSSGETMCCSPSEHRGRAAR